MHDTWQPLAARVNVSESSIGTCGMQVRRYLSSSICPFEFTVSCLPQPACPASRGQAQFCCEQSASASFSDDRTQVTLRYVRPSEPGGRHGSNLIPGGMAR